MNGRDAEAHAIIGFNGTGKSSLFAETIVPCYDLRSQKILILNSATPRPFENYYRVNNINALMRKWHGVILYHNPAGAKQTLIDVYNLANQGYFYNGALMIDDATKYTNGNLPQPVKDFLVDRKAFNLDLFVTTHLLKFVPPFCRSLLNTITLFATTDVLKSYKDVDNLDYSNSVAIYNAWKSVVDMGIQYEVPPVLKDGKVIKEGKRKRIQPHKTIATGV